MDDYFDPNAAAPNGGTEGLTVANGGDEMDEVSVSCHTYPRPKLSLTRWYSECKGSDGMADRRENRKRKWEWSGYGRIRIHSGLGGTGDS